MSTHKIKINNGKKSIWPSRPKMSELLDHSSEDGLITGTLSEYTNNRVRSIGESAFYNHPSLVSVHFPLVTSIGVSAFKNCLSLKSADFPLATSIGLAAFDSSALESISSPLVIDIGESAFNDCKSLKSADFPLVTNIGSGAFTNCKSLKSADFPLVTTINIGMFMGCIMFKSLILRADFVCVLQNANAIANTPIASGGGYIYVPSALIDTYKAASNWSTYAEKFRALEDYTVDGTTTGALDEIKI